MSLASGVTTKTPGNILFRAAVFFHGVTYDPKVVPTDEEMEAGKVGATQDGGKITITPEFYTPDVDGVYVPVKEFQMKIGETATMETSMLELTPDYIARSVVGEISETTDGNYDVVTSCELRSGHFYSGFGCVGEMLDGRRFVCVFKNALCTSGFSTETKNKENAKFTGTFECQSDVESSTTNLPYALFLRKADGWTPVTAEDIVVTAAS